MTSDAGRHSVGRVPKLAGADTFIKNGGDECMKAEDWSGCLTVSIDEDVVHGEPVSKGTRPPVEIVTNEVYAYMELRGQSEDEAIASTFESFPTTPGADALREVLAYREGHEHQLQP